MKHEDIKVGMQVIFNDNNIGQYDFTENFDNISNDAMYVFVSENKNKVFTVQSVSKSGVRVESDGYQYPAQCFDLIEKRKEVKLSYVLSEHKKSLLKAVIDGKDIEYRDFDGSNWEVATEPLYFIHVLKDEYVRVKPPEPEIRITYTPLFKDGYINNVEYDTVKESLGFKAVGNTKIEFVLQKKYENNILVGGAMMKVNK